MVKQQAPVVNVNEVSRISAGTVIKGEINSPNDLRIDGRFEGRIVSAGRVVVGEKAEIEGDILCENLDFWGKLTGNIFVRDTLTLKDSCEVKGELHIQRLVVELGAKFDGVCKMLTKEDIAHNAACFKKQMEKFIDFSEGKALMLNNADWLLNLNYVELLRDVGACFSVNNMLRAKCYEQRMEKGLSFLEFNYMIMQSYDFYYMFQHYGCNMQFGGDDQWSNMLGGTELIRRKLGKDAYAMTVTLLTDSQGKKMGKTAGNAVWLDPNKTSPFEFYQYWRNVGDADVMKCIRMLTFLPLEQIDEMSTWQDQRLNEAKEILAYEMTSMVHGKEEAEKAQNAARALFSGNAIDTEHMPITQLTEADLTDGAIGILTLMVKAGLAASNGEARRLVVQGGVLADGEKVAAPTVSFTAEQLAKGIVIKKGKKIYHKVTL